MGIMNYKSVVFSIVAIFLFSVFVSAETDVLDVVITEYVSQITSYDQVIGGLGVEPIFLTEAPGEAGEQRTGTSRTGIELRDTTITGIINISNVEVVGNQTFVSINVTINNTNNIENLTYESLPSYLSPAVINVSVDMDNPGSPNNISIFIPQLRANDSVIISYNVDDTGVGEPINFTEVYSFWRVFTGRTINITLNVTNSFIDDVPIYDLNLIKAPFPHSDIYDEFSYFNFTNLRGEDASNASIIPTPDVFSNLMSVLHWNASDRLLEQGETRQIIFDATAPTNLSYPDLNWSDEDDWADWLQIGNISATFKMNGSVSGLRLQEVESVPTEVRIAVTKERINESWYWNTSMDLRHDALAPVAYNLTQVTVWATQISEFTDPGDEATWVGGAGDTLGPASVFATDFGALTGLQDTVNATWELNVPWRQTSDPWQNYSILFNYSYVPIVWIDASFIVLDTPTQYFKLNETRSLDGEYLFVEEIYVLLGGYLIKVTKELTPIELAGSSNRYLVNITLENIGTEQTPDLVTMFDMVPRDFNPLQFNTENPYANRSMTVSESGVLRVSDTAGAWQPLYSSDYVLGAQDTLEIASGTYQGYWGYNIDFMAINATSPGTGRYDPNYADKEIGIAYKIQGNHSLVRIENAYIVGVDPIRLEGASPSQSVASRLRMTSSTLEYVVVLASLLVSIALLSFGFVYNRKK